jgi:hypothetical protein
MADGNPSRLVQCSGMSREPQAPHLSTFLAQNVSSSTGTPSKFAPTRPKCGCRHGVLSWCSPAVALRGVVAVAARELRFGGFVELRRLVVHELGESLLGRYVAGRGRFVPFRFTLGS